MKKIYILFVASILAVSIFPFANAGYGDITKSEIDSWDYTGGVCSLYSHELLEVWNSSTYYAAYNSYGGYVYTFSVSNTGTITKSAISSYSTNAGWSDGTGAMVHCEGNIYAAISETSVDHSEIDTFRIYGNNGTIVGLDNLAGTLRAYKAYDFLRVGTTDYYSVLYQSYSGSNWNLYIYEISPTDGTVTFKSSQLLKTGPERGGRQCGQCMVDADTIAAVTGGPDNDYFVSTVNISAGGSIGIAHSWEYDTSGSQPHAQIWPITGNVFALASENNVILCSIADDGTITESAIDSLGVAPGGFIEFFDIGGDQYGMTYAVDKWDDKYIRTLNITTTSITSADSWHISSYYIGSTNVVSLDGNYYLGNYQWGDVGGDRAYVFTFQVETLVNTAPTISSPSPTDGYSPNELTPTCSITVNDADGNNMDVTFATNSTGSWINMQTNATVANGTYKWVFSGASASDTKYWWRVYADDSNENSTETYSFTTLSSPIVTWVSPTPADGGSGSVSSISLNTTIAGADSAFFDWNYTLLNYYSFESYNATLVYDNSTHLNNATFSGTNFNSSNITTTGKYDHGLQFDGVNDYLDCGNKTRYRASEFTVDFWIYVEDRGTDYPYYASYMYNNGKNGFRIFGYQSTLYFHTGNGVASTARSMAVAQNIWVHVVALYDGTNMKLYRNGSYVTGIVANAPDWTGCDKLVVGHNNIALGSVAYAFKGKIDEFRYHDRALTSEEINASYDSSSSRLYHDGFPVVRGDYNYSAYAINDNYVTITALREYEVLNVAPIITGHSPTNGTTDLEPGPSTTVTFTESEGDPMSISFATNSSGAWVIYHTNTTAVSGDTVSATFPTTKYDTKYWWKVFVDDGIANITETYHFTTETFTLSPADFFVDNESSRNSLMCYWTFGAGGLPAKTDGITIEANNAASWAYGAGVYGTIYSGLGTYDGWSLINGSWNYWYHWRWSNLNDDTTFYFQGWNWNSTYSDASSGSPASEHNTTWLNHIPTLFALPENSTSTIYMSAASTCSGSSPGGGDCECYYKDHWVDAWNLSYTYTFNSGTYVHHNFSNLAYSTSYHFLMKFIYTSGDCNTDIVYGYKNATTYDGMADTDGDGYIAMDVRLYDSDSDQINVSIRENTSGAWVELENVTGWANTSTWMWNTYGAATNVDGKLKSCLHTNATSLSTDYWWKIHIDDGYDTHSYYRQFHTVSNWGPQRNYTLWKSATLHDHYPTAGAQTSTNHSMNFSAYLTDRNNDTIYMELWTNASGTWTRMAFADVTNASTAYGMGLFEPYYDIGTNTRIWWSVNATDHISWTNWTWEFDFTADYTASTGVSPAGGGAATPAEVSPVVVTIWWETVNGDVKVGPSGVSIGDFSMPWTVLIIVLFVIALVALKENKGVKGGGRRIAIRRK